MLARCVHLLSAMTSFLFRIGTLALLAAAVAPADVPQWNGGSERQDQGHARSSMTYCATWDSIPDGSTLARHRSTYCFSCERTPSGRIRRSSRARHAFQELYPCPSTGSTAGRCPGYVVDHVVPLKRGGADSPENMQWQTSEEGKTKDRVE
jgi:hypothetical protein